eukprot:311333-Pelagomonas_calceolata.AAC.3
MTDEHDCKGSRALGSETHIQALHVLPQQIGTQAQVGVEESSERCVEPPPAMPHQNDAQTQLKVE